MNAAVFSSFSILAVLLALAAFALPWWAVVDIAMRPKLTFVSTGLTKKAWLVLLIGFTVFTYFVGLGIALYYVFVVRPKMNRAASLDGSVHRLLRTMMVLLLSAASLTLPYGVDRVRSFLSSHTQQARIEGHMRGQCVSSSPMAEGKRFTVRLTNGRSGKDEGVATMAGHTGRTNFYFDVTSGEYKLTATSGSVSHHWALSYYSGSGSSPQIVPTPVAMNVPVSVVC